MYSVNQSFNQFIDLFLRRQIPICRRQVVRFETDNQNMCYTCPLDIKKFWYVHICTDFVDIFNVLLQTYYWDKDKYPLLCERKKHISSREFVNVTSNKLLPVKLFKK